MSATRPPTRGWYPDPLDDQRVRLWDGNAWTEQTKPSARDRSAATPSVPTRSPRPQMNTGALRHTMTESSTSSAVYPSTASRSTASDGSGAYAPTMSRSTAASKPVSRPAARPASKPASKPGARPASAGTQAGAQPDRTSPAVGPAEEAASAAPTTTPDDWLAAAQAAVAQNTAAQPTVPPVNTERWDSSPGPSAGVSPRQDEQYGAYPATQPSAPAQPAPDPPYNGAAQTPPQFQYVPQTRAWGSDGQKPAWPPYMATPARRKSRTQSRIRLVFFAFMITIWVLSRLAR